MKKNIFSIFSATNFTLFLLSFLLITTGLFGSVAQAQAWKKPAICSKIFKTWDEAYRKCRGLGVVRKLDSNWNVIGYGCYCQDFEKQPSPPHMRNDPPTIPGLDF